MSHKQHMPRNRNRVDANESKDDQDQLNRLHQHKSQPNRPTQQTHQAKTKEQPKETVQQEDRAAPTTVAPLHGTHHLIACAAHLPMDDLVVLPRSIQNVLSTKGTNNIALRQLTGRVLTRDCNGHFKWFYPALNQHGEAFYASNLNMGFRNIHQDTQYRQAFCNEVSKSGSHALSTFQYSPLGKLECRAKRQELKTVQVVCDSLSIAAGLTPMEDFGSVAPTTERTRQKFQLPSQLQETIYTDPNMCTTLVNNCLGPRNVHAPRICVSRQNNKPRLTTMSELLDYTRHSNLRHIPSWNELSAHPDPTHSTQCTREYPLHLNDIIQHGCACDEDCSTANNNIKTVAMPAEQLQKQKNKLAQYIDVALDNQPKNVTRAVDSLSPIDRWMLRIWLKQHKACANCTKTVGESCQDNCHATAIQDWDTANLKPGEMLFKAALDRNPHDMRSTKAFRTELTSKSSKMSSIFRTNASKCWLNARTHSRRCGARLARQHLFCDILRQTGTWCLFFAQDDFASRLAKTHQSLSALPALTTGWREFCLARGLRCARRQFVLNRCLQKCNANRTNVWQRDEQKDRMRNTAVKPSDLVSMKQSLRSVWNHTDPWINWNRRDLGRVRDKKGSILNNLFNIFRRKPSI